MCDFVCSRGDQELLLTKVCNRPQHCAVGSCDCSRHAGAGWRWRRRSRRSNDASNNTVLPVLSAYSFSQQPFDCVTSQQLCHSSERQCLYIYIYLYIYWVCTSPTHARATTTTATTATTATATTTNQCSSRVSKHHASSMYVT